MKSEIVQYEPVHAYELFDRSVREMDFSLTAMGDWEASAEHWKESGPAFTLLLDGHVTACGGVTMLDTTFGECWVLISKGSQGIIVYRNILKKFRELIVQNNYRRLQALVMEGFDDGAKLVEHLGFEFEGRMRKFGPNGETHNRYARVF